MPRNVEKQPRFQEPLAAKVPEIVVLFWVIKLLTTYMGEATSDFLKNWGNIKGGGTEVVLFAAGLILQFEGPSGIPYLTHEELDAARQVEIDRR